MRPSDSSWATQNCLRHFLLSHRGPTLLALCHVPVLVRCTGVSPVQHTQHAEAGRDGAGSCHLLMSTKLKVCPVTSDTRSRTRSRMGIQGRGDSVRPEKVYVSPASPYVTCFLGTLCHFPNTCTLASAPVWIEQAVLHPQRSRWVSALSGAAQTPHSPGSCQGTLLRLLNRIWPPDAPRSSKTVSHNDPVPSASQPYYNKEYLIGEDPHPRSHSGCPCMFISG